MSTAATKFTGAGRLELASGRADRRDRASWPGRLPRRPARHARPLPRRAVCYLARAQVASWFLAARWRPRRSTAPRSGFHRSALSHGAGSEGSARSRPHHSPRTRRGCWPSSAREYSYLLDAEAGEGRHWNNDGCRRGTRQRAAPQGCRSRLPPTDTACSATTRTLSYIRGRFINRPLPDQHLGTERRRRGFSVRVGGEVCTGGIGPAGRAPPVTASARPVI